MNVGSKALIVTVNFRRADCTLRFLKSLSGLGDFHRCHLTIVDNNSEDDSVLSMRREIERFSNVELLSLPRNRGYFGAAKDALDHYLSKYPLPDWVMVCNNDIQFGDVQFLSKLFRQGGSGAGIIAPSIISALTGHDANPSIRSRPTQLRMLRYRMWLSNYPAMWFKQWLSPMVRRVRFSFAGRTRAPEEGVKRSIYAPHGSFLIFTRKFFEAGGFIDDGFFLYAEEFSVAEMCLRLGLPILHDPSLRVWHQEGQTSGRMLSRKIYEYQKDGFAYALSRYKRSYPELAIEASWTRPAGPRVPEGPPVPAAGDRIP